MRNTFSTELPEVVHDEHDFEITFVAEHLGLEVALVDAHDQRDAHIFLQDSFGQGNLDLLLVILFKIEHLPEIKQSLTSTCRSHQIRAP